MNQSPDLNQTQSKIIEYYKMLDVIRTHKNNDFNVEHLKNRLSVSRTTADKIVNGLLNENIIKRENKRYIVNGTLAYFLGISIGTEHIRLNLIDLNFEPLTRNEIKKYPHLAEIETFGNFDEKESDNRGFCFQTPSAGRNNTFNQVHDLISKIISVFLAQAEQYQRSQTPYFPLAGIGIAVTGPVDYTEVKWRSAPEQLTKIQDITLQELIGYDNDKKASDLGIFLSFENNAKAAMISEYQYLLERDPEHCDEDIALLYFGSGIGSAAVLGKTLLRGSHNLSGEVGYLPTLPACTKNADGELNPSEVQETVDERVRSIQSLDEDTKLKNYYCVLTYLCNVINCVLGIDRVILVGHNIRQHENIIPALLEKRIEYTVASTQRYCRPDTGRLISGTAAIGAAIESYMCMCHFDRHFPKKRTNLAKDISWA